MLSFSLILIDTVKKHLTPATSHQNHSLHHTAPPKQHNTATPLPHHSQTPRSVAHQTPWPIHIKEGDCCSTLFNLRDNLDPTRHLTLHFPILGLGVSGFCGGGIRVTFVGWWIGCEGRSFCLAFSRTVDG